MKHSSGLEYQRSAAQLISKEVGVPIASSPRLFVESDSSRIQDIAEHFPLEDVVQYAAELHGHDPSSLGSMAIRLTDSGPEAQMYPRPCESDCQLYFPFIDLRIKPKTPAWYINAKLRHELHHPFESKKTPFYSRKYADVIIRGGGLVVGAGIVLDATLNHGVMVPHDIAFGSALDYLAHGVTSSVACGATFGGWMAAYALSKSEMAANVCAYRNRSFKPIK